ncbi:MAG: hypothetical protein H8E37_12280 [Planctomycetes bacterium]|nr:hypothetical protein [Planctomycetota bacterium]
MLRSLRVSSVCVAIPLLFLSLMPGGLRGDDTTPLITIDTPMSPPTWALLERQLLDANTKACEEFYEKYFDERGFLLCVERWGGDDGPDDAIENCLHWPILHAIGGGDSVLTNYRKAWEGHLRQYTLAKTVEVPFARDGMYYKEFPCQFDWLHNAEGLVVFCLQGLSEPESRAVQTRMKRYAGFYIGEDPQAKNYDPKHKMMRSMFNGSRGPLMRKATGLDWAGDPIEIEHRFELGHGERNYSEMVAHFKDYNDIIGDHPQNLLSTALPLNAFMLTGEKKYRDWILEYVGAWVDRMKANGNIIPTNIGLDGKPGSAADGKWYGGVYGWSFSVEVPQDGSTAHRNTHYLGLKGFMNAYLLTGDDKYLDPWRKQIGVINGQKKMIDGKPQYPRMYGDDGWYAYSPSRYTTGIEEIAYLTMKPSDIDRAANAWWRNLKEDSTAYAEASLRADLAQVRSKVLAMRKDKTTPDTRLADDPMKYNPASVASLVRLACGGLPTNKQGLVLHSRLRYFDPIKRRAGLPADCAALIERLEDETTTVTLVNTNQLKPRTVTIQAGSYAEHSIELVSTGGRDYSVTGRSITVKLMPGCGKTLHLLTPRNTKTPTLAFPWTNRE